VSLETWKEEFYPVPAGAVSREDALDHSIRKWEGLRPENLRRHGLMRDGLMRRAITEKNGIGGMHIDAGSCALCRHHEKPIGRCYDCPLYLVRGSRCDTPTDTEALSPYQSWLKSGSPVAMLELLDAAKAAKPKEVKS